MKRLIPLLLVAAMVLTMVPAFAVTSSAASATPEEGLKASYWLSLAEIDEGESGHFDAWKRIMGWHGGETTDYTNNRKFDQAIDQMLHLSAETGTKTGITEFGAGFGGGDYKAATGINSDNEYMVKWTGTMKATTAGTYTFVAHKVDNGCVIFVDGEKAFEFWGASYYFDDDGVNLLSEQTFTITEEQVGKDIEFEMWFLEIDGGEALSFSVTDNGSADGKKSMADAGFTFDLTATYYTCKVRGTDGNENADIEQYMQDGVKVDSNGNRANAADPGNHNFDEEELTNIKSEMLLVGSSVIPNFQTSSYKDQMISEQFGMLYDDYMVEFEGYLTPTKSGTYTFGTRSVDNCFLLQLEIDGEWKTVYELWGKGIFNDAAETYYNESVDLTAGTSYKLRAIFLELSGGEPLEGRIKINDEVHNLATSGVIFTTEAYEPGTAPITVDIFGLGSEWKYQTGSWANDKAPEAPAGWPNAIADTMQTGTAPMADEWATTEIPDTDPNIGKQANAYLWLAKEFTIEDLDALEGLALMADMHYDDDINLYINGVLVFDHDRWNSGTPRYKFADEASDLLKEGKNIIAVSLVQHWGGYDFDLGLSATTINKDGYIPMYASITTADELNAYVATINKFTAETENITHPANVYIDADIDMTGKEWTPIKRFVGTIHGNGHTLSGLTYITDVVSSDVALIVCKLSNLWQDNKPTENGTILDLNVKNSLLVAPKVEGNAVGAIVGNMDRGVIKNCSIEDVTVIGGDWTGGIAGRASGWSIIGSNDSPVENCSVKNSTIIATTTPSGWNKAVGGIVGTNDSTSKVILGDYTMENVVIMCDEGWTLKANTIGAPCTEANCEPSVGANAKETNVTIVTKADAAITEGAESTWVNTDASDVTITVSTTDNAITAVTVDGKALPASYYTVKETAENTTVLTLKKAYLQSLETGEYTVAVESYQGDVETTLTIANDDVQEAPPATGDAILFIALLATLSLAGVVFATKKRRSVK
ncbi:MAG: hypothetical protein IJX76_02040 [Clostridia bacterium]|nr:hypothetical protein [Clostridia bacterium]